MEKLAGLATTADTKEGLLLSLNQRLAAVEAALTNNTAAAVDTDVPTTGEASFRPDACAPLYSSFSRSALNDVFAPGNQILLYGGTEGPTMLRTLGHRNEIPTLLNEMRLTGTGVCRC